MANTVTITDDNLIIEPQGLDKIWSFTQCLTIPWAHVRGATHDPGMKDAPKGWRGPGLRLGDKLSGTFHAGGERQLWNVNQFDNTIVIELNNERYARIIISVDNPDTVAEKISAKALAQA